MTKKDIHIGIPRALLYHEFGALWTEFFRQSHTAFTVSSETNRQILDRSTMLAVDESCLPLKIYLGHVDSLLSTTSHIFIPRIAQYHKNAYFCAKFAGLPDIIKNTFNLDDNRLICPTLDTPSPLGMLKCLKSVCNAVHYSSLSGLSAYIKAKSAWNTPVSYNQPMPGRKVAVIGHSYLLNDNFFCRDVLATLKDRNVAVITPAQIPNKLLYLESSPFKSDIYWQLSAKLAGAVNYFSKQDSISGIIIISSFGCGPDSLVNEYLKHHILKNRDRPYIIINLDEHTGQAGLLTRLEAFLDLIDWRSRT